MQSAAAKAGKLLMVGFVLRFSTENKIAKDFIMKLKMKELPISERPYEKLELYGPEVLSNAELLAIIIKSGTREENSVSIAQRILSLNSSKDEQNLKFLCNTSIEEFMKIKGIGKVKAIQLKAIGELTKRISKPIHKDKIKIRSTKDVADLLMPELRYERREIVKLIILNHKKAPMLETTLTFLCIYM